MVECSFTNQVIGFEYRYYHIVLCLNVFAKLQDTRGASRQPVLIGIALRVYIC